MQDVLEHRPVFPGELVGSGGGLGLGQRLGLDPERVARAWDAGPDDSARVAPDDHGRQTTGQVALLHDL